MVGWQDEERLAKVIMNKSALQNLMKKRFQGEMGGH